MAGLQGPIQVAGKQRHSQFEGRPLMLFGYELEFFCINKRNEIVVPKPELHGFTDGGGILLEARGEPMAHPGLAEASLRLKIAGLKKATRQARRRLMLADEGDVSPRSLAYARQHKKF